MFTSFIVGQWKTFLVGIAAVAAMGTPKPITSYLNSITPNAPNISSSSGTSRNWSGYAATGGTFTAIAGTWTIPQATSNGHSASDATWVGIGGIGKSDLIQVGTQDIVTTSNQETTEAFYELLPNASQNIPVTVAVGDSVTASLTQESTNEWQISFKDNNNGQSYTNTFSYTSSLSSAEWIEEEPSNGVTELPLDNFGSVSFSNASVTENGNSVSISGSGAEPITLTNAGGQTLSSTSSLGSDGASFTVTRSDNVSSSPVPEFDRNPRGWRRQGIGIGHYVHKVRSNWVTPTASPQETETPTPTVSPTPNQRNFWGRWFHPAPRQNSRNRF
jgi:hypothetical protein